MADILIVDDEPELCSLVATLLGEKGHRARSLSSGEAALRAVSEKCPDLILLDLHLDGIDGIETLRRIRAKCADVPVVMVTAFGNVQAAVKAMKLGATDFVGKPFNNQSLLSTIESLLVMRRQEPSASPALIGGSEAFRKVMDMALKFAVPDINVLLLGETGTGKELFARAIHAASKRRNGPFVAVDCSTLAENLIESELFGHEKGAFTGATATQMGRLEMAQGGTLFLDEIGNLPLAFQAKLLRVLQERQIERVGGRETLRLDTRIVSATNVNLAEAIREGKFRQDLYYRLQEITINLPPLRERSGDLGRIAQHFVTLYARKFGTPSRRISDEALDALERYPWPGNVRELENVIKSAVVLALDTVGVEHLPPALREQTTHASTISSVSGDGKEELLKVEIELGFHASGIDLKALGAEAAEQAERSLLSALLSRGRMSSAQMAKLLSVDPKTLRTKLRRYGLETTLVTDT